MPSRLAMYGRGSPECPSNFYLSSRRRHKRCLSDWSSDVCSSDLKRVSLVWRTRTLSARPTPLGHTYPHVKDHLQRWSGRLDSNQRDPASKAGKINQTPLRPVISKWSGRSDSNRDRKSTRLNSSHLGISYAVFCLKKKKKQ